MCCKHWLTIVHGNQAENQTDISIYLLYRLVTGHTLWVESATGATGEQSAGQQQGSQDAACCGRAAAGKLHTQKNTNKSW